MQKIILLLAFAVVVVSATGCSSSDEGKSNAGTPDTESASCEKPPKNLEWSGKKYTLKAESTSLEAGMKYGFFKCDKGNVTPGDADDSITVYSVGNPGANSDIILTGKWGSALYSVASGTN